MVQIAENPLFEGLNPAQLDAVQNTVNQSALVLASAGSGKTAVLIRRIAYLIELGVPPSSIMAVTFTNKASLEMKDRLETFTSPEVAKKVMLGTFHKICIRMLKRFGDRVGLDRMFAIAAPTDQSTAMKNALLQHGGDTSAEGVRMMIGVVSKIKGDLLSPDDYMASMLDGDNTQYVHSTYNVYQSYQDELRRLNMLDFDDLIYYAVKLLETSDETRRYYQNCYSYVLLDEYQDTNASQYRLMALIAGKTMPLKPQPSNVLAVGDDAQSIYAFRGSDIQIILDFEKDFPEARTIRLEQNYRSTKAIVHTGNQLIKHNVKQKEKTSFTANANGDKIKVFKAYKSDDEADFVANEIKNLTSFGGYKEGDIAILYRANFLSTEMERKLIDQRINYKIVKGTGFFDRMEIRDTLAYLKVLVNPHDDIAMERVLQLTPGVGKTSIEKIKEEARSMNIGLSQMLKYFKPERKQLATALDELRNLLRDLYLIYHVSKEEKRADPVSKVLEIVWTRTGYMRKLKESKTDENRARVLNLKELKRVTKYYEEHEEDPSLSDFVEGIILQTSDDRESDGDFVKLMTIHASKGLEFPVVFIIGMNEEVLPHKNSIHEEGGLEEERRLCYVAITRAEKLLYMSYSKVRNMYGGQQWLEPSRFLEELPKEAIEQVF